MAFHITIVLSTENYIECTVEFKIKGDNYVSETKKTKETVGFSIIS